MSMMGQIKVSLLSCHDDAIWWTMIMLNVCLLSLAIFILIAVHKYYYLQCLFCFKSHSTIVINVHFSIYPNISLYLKLKTVISYLLLFYTIYIIDTHVMYIIGQAIQ